MYCRMLPTRPQELLHAGCETDLLLNACQTKFNATVVETRSRHHVKIVPVLSRGFGISALLFVEKPEIPICLSKRRVAVYNSEIELFRLSLVCFHRGLTLGFLEEALLLLLLCSLEEILSIF